MKIKKHCHLKTGDKIKVISGSNKGFIGKIKAMMVKKSVVFIEGILPRTKLIKNSQSTDSKKIELQIPIHISNVMLWDETSQASSRIGYKIIENKKYRYFKKSGNLV
jgi:large subunit ribosomal protein L24